MVVVVISVVVCLLSQDIVVSIATCGSSFDTELGVFIAQDLALIAANDDGDCASASTNTDSSISGVGLAGGTEYIIVVVRTS